MLTDAKNNSLTNCREIILCRLLKIKLIGFLKSADDSDISSVTDPKHVNSSDDKSVAEEFNLAHPCGINSPVST